MRRVLILGGTAWLGREVARRAVDSGAEVVCLALGDSGDVPAGARLVRADRRQPGAYDALTGDWDDVVEISYDAELVRSALEALAARAAHWTLVSTISVYARDDEPGADESARLLEPGSNGYGEQKVAAERDTADAVGDRLLIARAGLIVGPGDPTDRFGYWPARLSRGGAVVVPETDDRFVQAIDVGDLASWITSAGTRRRTGIVNAVGEPVPFGTYLAEVADVVGFDGALRTLDDAALIAAGVDYWAGPRSLPLWLPADATGFARRCNREFVASGGVLRPLRETIARTLVDEVERGVGRVRRAGLSAAAEAELLAGG
ncbi:nucleoside-diphosphate-sugar epimerase [Frondihabitans sp. PhB188]|uniref:NAD-dependent epimerase/dehydratase family protein n=1 Tax=Frondihabitans sp. PhB188 TaxID=2485200 RepID=UPI000F4AD2D8|nr:NAD-dependent epimerase/dehydratase family protein [Frondihabitans sp. PhB188]ROQ41616.1 nucleoside-diphosphate-sugar epimerase [Frondihabitans sp. PhB188]